MVETSTVIQIVSAVLGSSLILSGITTFFSEFINAPKIKAAPIQNGDGISVVLTNEGRAAAKNLYLTVESPTNVNYEIFATENQTIIKDDNRTLMAYFPHFVHGEGSLIRVDMLPTEQTVANHPFSIDYTMRAAYDQGSVILPNPEQVIAIPSDMAAGLTIAGAIIFTVPYFYTRGRIQKKHWKRRAVSCVAENIAYYKKHFRENPLDVTWDDDSKSINEEIIKLSKRIYGIGSIFESIEEFTYVLKFYTELSKRNIILKQAKDATEVPAAIEAKIKQPNCEVKTKAEDADRNIKWESYDVDLVGIFEEISNTNYSPKKAIDFLNRYRNHNVAIEILRPVASIVIALLAPFIGSYLIYSGNTLEWIERLEISDLWLVVIGGLLGISVYTILSLIVPMPIDTSELRKIQQSFNQKTTTVRRVNKNVILIVLIIVIIILLVLLF